MDQNTHEKIVNFHYCAICKSHNLSECQEPCNTCIANPVNFESEKPTKYEEDPALVKLKADLVKQAKLHVKTQ